MGYAVRRQTDGFVTGWAPVAANLAVGAGEELVEAASEAAAKPPAQVLAEAKAAKVAALAARTAELQQDGFVFRGKRLRFTEDAQSTWKAIADDAQRELDGKLRPGEPSAFPLAVRATDSSLLALPTPDDAMDLYVAVKAAKRLVEYGEVVLAQAVGATADLAAVAAVVDDR
jgi:hypothetical protein